jgi:hypothetical protein
MARQLPASRPLHVLLSEGASTSAREAVTILGLKGHVVEICDPDAHALARFSRFVGKFHRCPALAKDPAAYLIFIEKLLASRRFDVLLPIHEQGFLLARAAARIKTSVRISKIIAPRTARPASAGCWMSWDCRSRSPISPDPKPNCAPSFGFPAWSRPRSGPPVAVSGSCRTTRA